LYRVCAANIRRAGAARDRGPGARPDPARRLEREVARRLSENLLVQDLSVRALACLGETRDNETGQHIVRTPGYVEVLARHLAPPPPPTLP
jgi:response regulator RpfG family c-di-GMP phosphodiesterase